MSRPQTLPEIDPYEVLEVTPSATTSEIRSSYKRLVLLAHPDKNPHRPEWSERRVRELLYAFDLIGDSVKRARYDASIRDREFDLRKARPRARRRARPTERDLFFFRKNDDECLALRILYFLMHQRGKEAVDLLTELESRRGDDFLGQQLDRSDFIDCCFLLGEYLMGRKRYLDAFRRFERLFLLERGRRFRRPHFSLATDYLKSLYLKHLPRVLPAVELVDVLDMAPVEIFAPRERSRLQVEIARAYQKLDQPREARRHLDHALELDPRSATARRFEKELAV